jgi:microcompartment protein CcmK/EutM
MLLCKVVGSLVSTQKDPKLRGTKLLVTKEVELDGRLREIYHIAVDSVGAGEGELVVIVRGSSARMAENTKGMPIDSAIVAIVDSIEVDGEVIFRKS